MTRTETFLNSFNNVSKISLLNTVILLKFLRLHVTSRNKSYFLKNYTMQRHAIYYTLLQNTKHNTLIKRSFKG